MIEEEINLKGDMKDTFDSIQECVMRDNTNIRFEPISSKYSKKIKDKTKDNLTVTHRGVIRANTRPSVYFN